MSYVYQPGDCTCCTRVFDISPLERIYTNGTPLYGMPRVRCKVSIQRIGSCVSFLKVMCTACMFPDWPLAELLKLIN